MSARLPIEAKVETPRLRSPARSISASPSAPLCERKPTLPAGGIAGAKVALSRACGDVFRIPRQFGPIKRMPAARQISTSSRCRTCPSSPTSANPAEMTTTAGTRLAAHSRATSATAPAGTAITARSTSPGTSVIVGYARTD
jgi:hypothetical protein